jgi:hypothetical protein
MPGMTSGVVSCSTSTVESKLNQGGGVHGSTSGIFLRFPTPISSHCSEGAVDRRHKPKSSMSVTIAAIGERSARRNVT